MAFVERVRSLVPTPRTPTATPSIGRQAKDVAERILPDLRTEQARLQRVDDYMRGIQDLPVRPEEGDGDESKAIMRRSIANVLPLVVSGIGQTLKVTGYRASAAAENAPAWRYWQANGWDSRQIALHRASLTYGVAYAVVLPGDTAPVMRPVSPRRMLGVYADQAADEWPLYGLEEVEVRDPDGRKRSRLQLLTDGAVHYLSVGEHGDDLEWIESREHNLGVCPIVRYAGELDLEGRYTGEIEPLISYQDRHNQATYDESMVRSFGAFVVRTLSGVTVPGMPGTVEGGESGDRDAARRAKVPFGADRILVAQDPEARFGSLPATPLDGHLKSRDQTLRDLAIRAQMPPKDFLGTGNEANAEATAATEAGLQRKSAVYRLTFGESHEQTSRLGALCDGDRAGWEDTEAATVWGDTEARSLAQVADAIVKLAGPETMVDPDLLLPMLPGWTQRDLEQAREYRERMRAEAAVDSLDAELKRQSGSSSGGVPGNDPSSRPPASGQ